MKRHLIELAASIGLCASAFSPLALAQDATALPAMNFASSVASDNLFTIIKGSSAFANLDKELIGAPVMLRVTHTLQPTTGGKATGLLSAIFSGGTLGLLPMVTNNNLVVTYEVMVHGKDIASYSYTKNFTRSINIWAKDDTQGLGKDGMEWVKSTASEFTAAAATDEKLASLKREYDLYFAPGAK